MEDSGLYIDRGERVFTYKRPVGKVDIDLTCTSCGKTCHTVGKLNDKIPCTKTKDLYPRWRSSTGKPDKVLTKEAARDLGSKSCRVAAMELCGCDYIPNGTTVPCRICGKKFVSRKRCHSCEVCRVQHITFKMYVWYTVLQNGKGEAITWFQSYDRSIAVNAVVTHASLNNIPLKYKLFYGSKEMPHEDG